ncbi:MAG TPA: hypothetical protein VKB38_13030 [Terracidiphilus sp.]|nr:hypothetical protein [Terracidiphilus sp.]
MIEEAHRPLLIRTKRGALIALGIAILLTLRNLVALYQRLPGHEGWFTRYPLPPTTFSRFTDFFAAALFAWPLTSVLRRARAAERLFLGLWLAIVVLAPVRDLNSPALARIYEWVRIAIDFALIPVASWMYRTLPERATDEEPQPPDELPHPS